MPSDMRRSYSNLRARMHVDATLNDFLRNTLSFSSMWDSIYSGKKVLVTGNTGFKGSWLSAWLEELGAKVVGISWDIPTKPSMFVDVVADKNQRTHWVDICETERIVEIFNDERPDFLFHLAAQPLVGKSYSNPIETWRSNAFGTASILESIRTSQVENLVAVFITSDKVYQNNEWVWAYRENDKLGGVDPYSASKAAAELAISSYVSSGLFSDKDIRIASARAGNVIGGGDWSENRVIPDTIRAWMEDETLELRNPHSTRPWQHVLEPLGGYILLGAALRDEKIKTGESFNFGPNPTDSKNVQELVEIINNELGSNKPFQTRSNNLDFKESGLLALSSEKARSELKWKPLMEFSESAKLTAEWYKKRQEGSDPRITTIGQIKSYREALLRDKNWGNLWNRS